MIQHERDLLAHIITENEFFPFVNAAIRNHLKMVRDIWEWVGEAAFSSSTSLHREMLAANNYIAFTAAADEGVESLAMLRQLYFWSGSKGERQEALKADEYQAFFGAACGIKANLDMVKQILEWGVEEGLEKEMLTSLDQRRGTHEFKDDIAQFIKQVKGGVR